MGCETLMKFFLIGFNAVFFVIGAVTLSIGIWVKVDMRHLLELTKDVSGASLSNTDIPSLLSNAVVVMIICGAVIFLLGFVGCCGALKNRSKAGKLFLKIYAAVILIVLVMEVAGVAVAWLFLDKVEGSLKGYLDSSLTTQYQSNFTISSDGTVKYSSRGDPMSLAWDIVQLQFECCGRINGSDYNEPDLYWSGSRAVTLSNGTQANMTIPPSCCSIKGETDDLLSELKDKSDVEFKLMDPSCPFQPANSKLPGCYEEVRSAIKKNSVIFLAIGGVTFFVELLCLTFACCTSKRDSKSVEDAE